MNSMAKEQLPTQPMTVDEYLVWAETHSGKYELHDGVVVKMAAERTGHLKVKGRVFIELLRAARQFGKTDMHVLPHGATVRVGLRRAFEPDALIYLGPELADDVIEVPNPVVVVEVLSPSTGDFDMADKLVGYFGVPSIAHYLIVNPAEMPAILHSRQADGTILTRLLHSGAIKLDPPGIEIDIPSLLSAN